ncbi:hypothetical protein [Bacillus alkalicellulosilyticus]|uniref:hypothetical protein n=1 Tax=Alkalihalobacterium alkalicellulosilyticum TaxID=1912214 RepID=UPI000996365F|nr:hypothetical protein [Bacillus alkalicellulosilyticus]
MNIFSQSELSKEKMDQESLEFQMFRMREKIKDIALKWNVVGIEQTTQNKWVIVYTMEDEKMCKIMLTDCEKPFSGIWDYCMDIEYQDPSTILIKDIKGEENQGYGSICMKQVKHIAQNRNAQFIIGDIVERDWDHLDRLIHFYKKHDFFVDINHEQKSGQVLWNPR